MDRKSRIKIGIIVASLTVAAVVTVVTRASWSSDEVKPGEDERSWWICASCNHSFELGQKELEAARANGDIQTVAAEGTRFAASIPRLKCPSCGQMEAVPAVKCPEHDDVYPNRYPDGHFGTCPKCEPMRP